MVPSQSLESQLKLSSKALSLSLQDISEEEARQRPHGLTPIVWQMGHIALSDGRLVHQMEGDLPVPGNYESLFQTGTSGEGEGDLPSLEQVAEAFQTVHARLLTLAAGDLDQPCEGGRLYSTLGEALMFIHFHRGWHMGKIMTLRSCLGKPALM